MTYAYAKNDKVEKEKSSLPESEQLISDPGIWITGLPYESVDIQQATGWYAIVDSAKPPDTATTTFDRSLQFADNAVTVVWTERPLTSDELTAKEEAANADEIDSKLTTVDLPAMQAILDQTNANIRTDPSQEIKDTAQAVRRLIRKVEELLDGTS